MAKKELILRIRQALKNLSMERLIRVPSRGPMCGHGLAIDAYGILHECSFAHPTDPQVFRKLQLGMIYTCGKKWKREWREHKEG